MGGPPLVAKGVTFTPDPDTLISQRSRRSSCLADPGSVPEWPKGADCKSAGYAYVGSNPTRPTV